ncbi:uncharacterized protein CDAR_403581 [Caerostris darwini]|uniref:Gustatory receptor n=1 Tax=Caerostris darwini TaxID=1538125 RepID=A0AAV4PTP8_9ARAC|nr:uncharacterized protein CDAR_403581 [Caerostris darwini]
MSTSQHSNGVSNSNSELPHFEYKLPRLFLVFLRWAGFVEESDRNFKSKFIWIFFYVIQLLASAFMVTVVCLQRQVLEKMLVSVTSLACNQAIWHCMRYKRKTLTAVLQRMQLNHLPLSKLTINFSIFVILCMPTIILILRVYLEHSVFWRYSLGQLIEYFVLHLTIPTCIFFLADFLLPCLITLLYCSLCFRCSKFINNLTNEIENISPQQFGPCVQFDILKRKSKVDDVLEDLENIFSKPSLFLIMLNFVTCVYHLGTMLVVSWGYRHIIIESLFYSVVHFICVTAVFWSAGSVPVALNKLNRFFYRKAHSRLILVCSTSEGRKLKRELVEKPEFVLTGCDVIVYRRSSILAFVGTLLTYSIITMDIKDKNH